MSFLDMNQDLLDMMDLIDIQYSPLVDAKQVPHVEIGLVEGAVANDENEEILKIFRQKCQKLVAFGTCACTGGISGLRNLSTKDNTLSCGYIDTPTTVDGKIPSSPTIPKLRETVRPLDQVVKIDYHIPGCPPLPSTIKETIVALTKGMTPTRKTKNLCEECDRTKEKMLVAQRDYLVDEVASVHELENISQDMCFLEQGVLCMGPATVGGCGALCPQANMPCRSCQGPPHGAAEQGAKLINCLSSILPAGGLMFQEDIVGVGYCYSMPISIFPDSGKETKE
jgi:F420-non-reducing hydrogenase small subunit